MPQECEKDKKCGNSTMFVSIEDYEMESCFNCKYSDEPYDFTLCADSCIHGLMSVYNEKGEPNKEECLSNNYIKRLKE